MQPANIGVGAEQHVDPLLVLEPPQEELVDEVHVEQMDRADEEEQLLEGDGLEDGDIYDHRVSRATDGDGGLLAERGLHGCLGRAGVSERHGRVREADRRGELAGGVEELVGRGEDATRTGREGVDGRQDLNRHARPVGWQRHGGQRSRREGRTLRVGDMRRRRSLRRRNDGQ